MSLWKPAPVTEEPEIVLRDWAIFEATFENNENDRSRHFVGANITEGGTGRVSSKIEEFDQENMTGRTRSGRVYKLHGAPGFSSDGMYVWGHWAGRNAVTDVKDVSAEYYQLAKEPTAAPVESDAD